MFWYAKFNRRFRDFLVTKMKNYYFSENAGFLRYQNEHNIASPKNNLTTVFVAESTDPPIKNGVYVYFRPKK